MGIFLSDRNIFTRQEYFYQAEKVLPGEKSFTRLGRWECRRSQAASPDPRGTLKIFLHFPASTFVHLSRHTLPNHRDPLAPSVHNEPFHPSPPRNSPSTELHQQWLGLHLHWVPYLHLAVIVEIDSSLKIKISPPFSLMPSPVCRRCACRRSSPQLAGHAWPWAPSTPPSPFTWTQPLPRRCGLQPCRLWPTSQLLLPTPCNIVHWSFLIMKCTLQMPDPRHWGSQLVGRMLCSRSWSRPLASRCPCAPCAFLQPCRLKKQKMKNENVCNRWSTLSFAFVCSELPHCFHHIGAPLLSSRFRNLWYFESESLLLMIYCQSYIFIRWSFHIGDVPFLLFLLRESDENIRSERLKHLLPGKRELKISNLKLTSLAVLSPHPTFRVLQMKDTWEIVRWSVQ